MKGIKIINVTADNVSESGVFCIKDKKAPGFAKKVEWFKNKLNKDLRIKLAVDNNGKQLGFIEFIPSELAWRPISAKNYLFIQCIAIFGKKERNQLLGYLLIETCEKEAMEENKDGVCTMSSNGPWIAGKQIFEKNGYAVVDQLGRFELMAKSFENTTAQPKFNDWEAEQTKYKGWHLIYSDQCPWHEKAIIALKESAIENKIQLKIKKLKSPNEAQVAPSGFGTFSLIKDGKLLADHYISRTRFENILKKELHS